MNKTKVAVLFGGCSTEHEVSLQSAAAVIAALPRDIYEVLPVGITRDGRWFYYEGAPDRVANDTWLEKGRCIPAFFSPNREMRGLFLLQDGVPSAAPVDVVFPVLHGKYGEDGAIQGLLELAGIPYTGCGVTASALCMDKDLSKRIAASVGVSSPKSLAFSRETGLAEIVSRAQSLGFPLFVKPACSGSSIGITKAANVHSLVEGVNQAFLHDRKILIEQNLAGWEVGCAVLGNEDPLLGEIDQIRLLDHLYDYEEKYAPSRYSITLPAQIENDVRRRIEFTARTLYKAFGCEGFARVDLFLTEQGEILFNEINTIPGFTLASRYPHMFEAAGISFAQVLDRIIRFALASRSGCRRQSAAIAACTV